MHSDFTLTLGNRLLAAGTAVCIVYLAMTGRSAGQHSETNSAPPQSASQTDRQRKATPQENMGQQDTRSGGAPASSPQGDTPPGMQPVPSAPEPTSSPK